MKLTETKQYAILFLRQSEQLSDTEISKKLKINIDDVRNVLKENESKKSDENTIPEKKSKNSAKMKDLMMIKTQSGKSGIASMTREASEFSDAVRPNMESVRATRLHKHIFRPNDTETGNE